MKEMINSLVFREEPLTDVQVKHRYEHNERTAKVYANENINLALSGNNIHLKAPTGTYEEMFQEKLNNGEISIKGLKPDAAHFSEIIVAVNRDYWVGKTEEEIYGFFSTVYEHLKNKFGEENVLSAVIHADEESEGRINYHLHFVAIPVVHKKRYYTKRSKQYKELAEQIGKENILLDDERLLKGTENQVSHAKLFQSSKDDKHRIIYSYAVWQDEIMEVIKKAGFTDIRRGTQNQKAKHLHPMAYKALMERIEAKADNIRQDIVAVPLDDDNYSVDKKSLDAIYDLQEQVAKEKAGYEFAVEALEEEQQKVYTRQNQVYQIAVQQKEIAVTTEDLKKLQQQADELYQENVKLKAIAKWLQDKLYSICQSFAKVIQLWNKMQTGDDTQETADEITNEMQSAVRNFNNEDGAVYDSR